MFGNMYIGNKTLYGGAVTRLLWSIQQLSLLICDNGVVNNFIIVIQQGYKEKNIFYQIFKN